VELNQTTIAQAEERLASGEQVRLNVSIVIPVYNEAESLPVLHQTLHQALDEKPIEWEVVYVDDGSNDASLPI